MASAVKLRTDYTASDLRRLAADTRHANQSRRLLSLAAVLDGMDREQAARIGGMDRQTLRDWVHRFNEQGPDGLKDIRAKGGVARLTAEQLRAFGEIVGERHERSTCSHLLRASRTRCGMKKSRMAMTASATRRTSGSEDFWRTAPRIGAIKFRVSG